ncbi:Dps family protein [Pontibacter liquoris]|uniref:Dps family protein n=1 Tax=Pontibacter liquoris TaxID=2905677 RepID=UPI001FA7602F|nr:Dps family protein [Pontibacter liquoris]
MGKLTQIGLEKEDSQQIGEKLNELLANYHLYYQNLRGFHWNIKGVHFFQLHAKFEELYTNTLTKIDEIAERILTIGQKPLHTFTDYIRVSTIQETSNLSGDKETVTATHQNLTTLINLERELLILAADKGDEGTVGMLSEDINENEKILWMLNAFLS